TTIGTPPRSTGDERHDDRFPFVIVGRQRSATPPIVANRRSLLERPYELVEEAVTVFRPGILPAVHEAEPRLELGSGPGSHAWAPSKRSANARRARASNDSVAVTERSRAAATSATGRPSRYFSTSTKRCSGDRPPRARRSISPVIARSSL